MSEFLEQVMVINYINVNYPDVIAISTLNGVYLPVGLAKKVAQLNPKKGISDIIILEPKGVHHGLIIELKRTGEKITKKNGELLKNNHLYEQNDFLEKLKKKGYIARFAIGFEETRNLIEEYMNGKI